ncbi:MAG: class I SAM-dependent methyltransferase [Anaerolineales bacterium]
MPTPSARKLNATFGRHAQAYVTSPTHASGHSLARLRDHLPPVPGGWALDVATGGGHTAARYAAAGMRVVASDLVWPMLRAARGQHGAPNGYVQGAAEALPVQANAFDVLTCRIAAHHFDDVRAFLAESYRALKPGGGLGIVDIISPEMQDAARYCNAFETLRDPSHQWAHTWDEWHVLIKGAGFRMQHAERVAVAHPLSEWAARTGCTAPTQWRLRAMLVQAPPPVRQWYAVKATPSADSPQDLVFAIQQAVFVARKPGGASGV